MVIKKNPTAETMGQQNKNQLNPDYTPLSNSGATIQFSQDICDSYDIQLRITLEGSAVNITDPNGNTIKFLAYLVPELRASLLEVEGKFWEGLSHGQI